jgi:hypothetical protein
MTFLLVAQCLNYYVTKFTRNQIKLQIKHRDRDFIVS